MGMQGVSPLSRGDSRTVFQLRLVFLDQGVKFSDILIQSGLSLGEVQPRLSVAAHADVVQDGVLGIVRPQGASLDMGVLGAHVGDLLGGEHPGGEVEAGQGGDAFQNVGVAVLQLDIVEDHLFQRLHAPHPFQALHGVGGVHVAAEEDPLQGLGSLQGEGIVGDLFGGIQPQVLQLGVFGHIPEGAVADIPVDADALEVLQILEGRKIGYELALEKAQILVLRAVFLHEMLEALLLHPADLQDLSALPEAHLVVHVIGGHIAGGEGAAGVGLGAGDEEAFVGVVCVDEPGFFHGLLLWGRYGVGYYDGKRICEKAL